LTDFESLIARVAQDLRTLDVQWAIVGGIAMGAHGEPRFTRDLDVAAAVMDDRQAEVVVREMMARGYRVLAVVEQTATGRLATVRLSPPGHPEGPIVDLLFASSGIEQEVVAAAETLEVLPGLQSPVARLPHMLALKILSRDDERRPQDRLDIHALLQRATSGEISAARESLSVVTNRGCNRGRDLQAGLDDALREFPHLA